ncbi:D-alanyl-lipoteichoic acid biosynthesis protein DltD, partial [Staphylococcus epidermidis]
SLQATGNHLNGKKAVVVISPQWFVPQGVKPEMFDFFYSPLQTSYFLIHAKDSESTRYAAKRILELTSDTTNGVMRDA